MAFDSSPSTWLGAGYDTDAGTHTISFNTNDASSNKLLVQLTDALADPTTGDIRDVMIAICEAFYLAWAGTATANRPTKMSIKRSATATTTAADSDVVFLYTFKFIITPSTFKTANE